MRVKGALHVHSNLSHDGRLSIAESAELYRSRGFHFVAMGDHSQDMDQAKVRGQVEQCAAQSGNGFLMIPGIEYSCVPEGMHILGIGCVALTAATDPVAVARLIRDSGGIGVLAHPRRFGWQASSELLGLLDAAEYWNVGYDGKYLPSKHAPQAYRRMMEQNPRLLAMASHDLHAAHGFYDVSIRMEVAALTREAVMEKLRQGQYEIASAWFRSGPRPAYSAAREAYLRTGGSALQFLRGIKHLLVGAL